jgi:3-dehydroquinate synthase
MRERETLKSITVGLGERSYPIYFGTGILTEIGKLCRNKGLGTNVAVVTNPTVGALYFDQVARALVGEGFTVSAVEIPDGEEFKNIETLKGIYDRLIDAGLDRGAFIVALGGGVVGDIAGYAAASYLRGIPFVQVPTTLLAQVDSSVGGKTGINHAKGKNLIGAFYQPRLVLVDVATLDTLQEREYLSGLAEVAKYGIVLNRELFDFVADHADMLLARDKDCLLDVIERSCTIKANVVENDEREAGLRTVLNYGHTIGHVVETLTGYVQFKHGEAVAVGMAQAAKYSEYMTYASKDDTEKIMRLLKSLHLPVDLPRFNSAAFSEALLRDKKVRDGGINFVFNRGIGSYHIARVDNIPLLLEICGIGD